MSIIFDIPTIWSSTDIATVHLARKIIDVALEPYTWLEDGAFDAVIGAIHVRFTKTLQYHALAKWGVIRFRDSSVITVSLVVHEMGHLFCARAKNLPVKQMLADGIHETLTIAASSWIGNHPPSLVGYNDTERFCNLWEVWALGLFAENKAAKDVRAWMDANMAAWCAAAMREERKA